MIYNQSTVVQNNPSAVCLPYSSHLVTFSGAHNQGLEPRVSIVGEFYFLQLSASPLERGGLQLPISILDINVVR